MILPDLVRLHKWPGIPTLAGDDPDTWSAQIIQMAVIPAQAGMIPATWSAQYIQMAVIPATWQEDDLTHNK